MNHACKTSSRLLLYFINDILDLGRIDNEAFRIQIQGFRLDQAMEEIQELFES